MKLSEAIAKFEDALEGFTVWHSGTLEESDNRSVLLLEGSRDSDEATVEMRIIQVVRRGQANFEPVEYAYPQEDEFHFDVFTWSGTGFDGPKRKGRFTGGIG